MDIEQIRLRKRDIVSRFGEWTAHNIHLMGDVYTFEPGHPRFQETLTSNGLHLRRILQIVSDGARAPLGSLRVLDLGCLEGLYGLEFARQGARVTGIEGRAASVEKARFAKDVLALSTIEFVEDDVRNLGVEKYGRFDVVLCLGLLYHLDAPDVFEFVERISEVCQGIAILDTHVGIRANRSHTHRGHEYRGWSYREHPSGATKEDRLRVPWASLDNERSFWFTRPSLFNLLTRVGFTSVYTCQTPAFPGQTLDRDTLVAVKGSPQQLVSTPVVNGSPESPWPEERPMGVHPAQASLSNKVLTRTLGWTRRLFRGSSRR